MLSGLLIGTLATVYVIRKAAKTRRRPLRTRPNPHCQMSLVLVCARGNGVRCRLVDESTGKGGFGHIAIDTCETDEQGKPVLLECGFKGGVAYRPASKVTGGKPFVRIYLPLVESAHLYGCATAKLGETYDIPGLLNAKPTHDGTVCSKFVYECLPKRFQEKVSWPEWRAVSPNDFARAFGIKGPRSRDVMLMQDGTVRRV